MAKEILLYGAITEYSARDFINEINDLNGEDAVMRVNSEGGDVSLGWGMVAKWAELEGNKFIKIDGKAHSMAAYFIMYAGKENVEALDVAEFVIHRAAYPEWLENSDLFTDEVKAGVERINKSLRKVFEARIDVSKFEEMKGVKVADIFSMDNRIDVTLTAQEAKKVGLIGSVKSITPKKKAEINANMERIAARYEEPEKPAQPDSKQIKSSNMNIEKLKSEHPEVYAQAVKIGQDLERDRVGAWMQFVDIDPEAVATGIDEGKDLSHKAMAEFTRKALSAEQLAKVEADGAGDLSTQEEEPKLDEEDAPEVAEAKKLFASAKTIVKDQIK